MTRVTEYVRVKDVTHAGARRSASRRAAVVAAALALTTPATARAQAANNACSAAASTSVPGIMWQGSEHLGLRDIAGLLAPVLWFSADEPLLEEGRGPIPGAHPCDAPSDHPVVYYQVTTLTYRGG